MLLLERPFGDEKPRCAQISHPQHGMAERRESIQLIQKSRRIVQEEFLDSHYQY